MASNYLTVFAVAITLAICTFSIPWVLAECFPWRNLYNQRHGRPTVVTKSYKGRTALITGANGAYGSRAAKLFAHREIETLVLIDVKDCTSLKDEIEDELREKNKPIPDILVWQVDMFSYADCQALVKKASELKHIDHALMTAGILSFNRRESPEGWETTIQINFFSSALLGLLLLPLLKSSPGNPNPPVLTFVTSFGIYPSSYTLSMPSKSSYLKHLSNNKDGLAQGHQYGRSKALLLYFTRELAARTARARGNGMRPVTVNSADPGSAWTPLTHPNQDKLIPRLITNLGAREPKFGAAALVNGVSAAANAHGEIMMDFETSAYPPFMERKSGREAQQRVWEETRDEFEAKVPPTKAIYAMLDQGLN